MVLLSFPFSVIAQNGRIVPDKPGQLPDVGGGSNNLVQYITYLISHYLLSLAGVIAMLFIIIGGYQYIFSGGNEALAKKGKTTLTNAVLGLIIIILSFVIVKIVSLNLGAT